MDKRTMGSPIASTKTAEQVINSKLEWMKLGLQIELLTFVNQTNCE